MKLTIEIPDYTTTDGFRYDWCDKSRIATSLHDGVFVLKATRKGWSPWLNNCCNCHKMKYQKAIIFNTMNIIV